MVPPLVRSAAMCRNIRILFNFEPPATDEEIHAAALQFVRKVSGTRAPSRENQELFDRAVAEVAKTTHTLVHGLVTKAAPRDRLVEAERAKARGAARFRPVAR